MKRFAMPLMLRCPFCDGPLRTWGPTGTHIDGTLYKRLESAECRDCDFRADIEGDLMFPWRKVYYSWIKKSVSTE